MHDSSDGFDRVPDRYEGDERETIDKIRDSSMFFAGQIRPLAADCLYVYPCSNGDVCRFRMGHRSKARVSMTSTA